MDHSKKKPTARLVPYQKESHQPKISRWQEIVMGTAGTTAAIISEESMKCLKYCLCWLNYAIQYIEQQLLQLKNYTEKNVLSQVKKNIVGVLRKVVDIISKYAGNSLPVQSRQTVRNFILHLPERWTHIGSALTTPTTSPLLNSIDKDKAKVLRLQNFGQESIEMLGSVASVFSDTIQRAESWISCIQLTKLPPIRSLNKES